MDFISVFKYEHINIMSDKPTVKVAFSLYKGQLHPISPESVKSAKLKNKATVGLTI